jgi:hypothetical protein
MEREEEETEDQHGEHLVPVRREKTSKHASCWTGMLLLFWAMKSPLISVSKKAIGA